MPHDKSACLALSPDQLLGWLAEVADNHELNPIASRIAVYLSREFGGGKAFVALLTQDVACRCAVSRNTAVRTLAALRAHGHLNTKSGGRGRTLAYAPAFRGE